MEAARSSMAVLRRAGPAALQCLMSAKVGRPPLFAAARRHRPGATHLGYRGLCRQLLRCRNWLLGSQMRCKHAQALRPGRQLGPKLLCEAGDAGHGSIASVRSRRRSGKREWNG